MATYDTSNAGAIWKNEDRKTDAHPHFRGSAEVTCAHCKATNELWVAAWKRASDASDRAPALKFKFDAKEERAPSAAPADFDEDIPF